MADFHLVYAIPDAPSQSWRFWQEIRHYGVWLRCIGDFHSKLVIGGVPVEPWSKKERQRAKEISNRYFAHSEAVPRPNGTVKVSYRYKKKAEDFSLSPKQLSDLRDEVLTLVSKHLILDFKVICGTCRSSSDGGPIDCEHADYSDIEDMEPPYEFIRPQNAEVIGIIYTKSDIAKGTSFTSSMILPALAKGPDIKKLASPVGEVDTMTGWRDGDRICLCIHSTEDQFTGTVREIGFFVGDTLILYAASSA